MTTALLSRYAECLFWFGRYTERTACLARLLEVQSSINRGRTGAARDWGWVLTLYDDHDRFRDHYEAADAPSVTSFYVTDRRNPGSIISCIHIARENARTLRAILSTELWQQVNTFYNRFRELPPSQFTEGRLSHTCQFIKKECYAQMGVAEATLYRDPAWSFFWLGVLVERADQMSRLLDVRFALVGEGGAPSQHPLGDFGFWSLLLRSAATQQAFLRTRPGRRDADAVARFLIFDAAVPRSIRFCVEEMAEVVHGLRARFGLRANTRALERIDVLREILAQAGQDPKLVQRLHSFNDHLQRELIDLSEELSFTFFGHERPDFDTAAAGIDESSVRPAQSQSQSGAGSNQTQTQTQSQSAP